jgi:hypothetical protein
LWPRRWEDVNSTYTFVLPMRLRISPDKILL